MAFAVYDNSPLLGYIEWVDLNIQYEGTTHAITDGFTAYRYVWWDPAVSTANLQVADTLPTLSDDALLLFLNKDGIHVTVPKSTVVDGSLIVSESILANAIGANQIQTDHLDAEAVTADKIAAGAVVAEKLGAWEMLVGQHIQSIDYDGTDVATGDATAGFRMEAGGDAEFNNVRVRGDVEASEFHGAPTASILGVNGTFDTDTSGWVDYDSAFTASQIARDTTTVRSGAGSLRIESSSGAGVRAAYTEVTVAAGDIVHASGWVRKDDVSDNAAESWWDTVTVNVDFYDGTDALVHQYFNESIQANAVEWRLLEVYAAAPLDLGITKARVYFSSYSNAAAVGKYALYLDDVVIGIAPLLEVPYMVTHEDGERKRSLITPQQFAFESQFSNYPYGLLARHNAHTPSLRVTGPYGYGSSAPQLELEHDLLNSMRYARFGVDQVVVPNGSESQPGVAVASDLDTGIFRYGPEQLAVTGGGVEQLRAGNAAYPGILIGGALGGTLPHIRSINDADTGIRFHTTNQLILMTGGSYALGFDASQRMYYYSPNTTASAANLFVTGTGGQVYRSTSSRKIKRDIESLTESVVDRLRPVTYKVKPENVTEGQDPEKQFLGLIAEEVAEADPRLAQVDEDGEVVYFDTNGLMAHMIAELKSLRDRVAELEAAAT